MKREGNLYGRLLSDENLKLAIQDVNRGHRWLPRHRPNKTTAWVEETAPERVAELREYITGLVDGTAALSRTLEKRRYDRSAGKWRVIHEPRLWPDQYVHHALVQVIEPVIMRGMDHYCCGSVRGRGIHYGVKAIKKWMKNDRAGTRYCLEMDIRHFYESIRPEVVMDRMRSLIKDGAVLNLCEAVVRESGVLIGLYTSQWFANAILQPLDQLIRESGLCGHYLRYIDNFTVFGPNKRKLRRLVGLVEEWLAERGMTLKGNWQIFPTESRRPQALGYRYGRGYTLLRKRNLFRLKRSVARCRWRRRRGLAISRKAAAGLLSRLGQLRWCNHVAVYHAVGWPGLQRELKRTVRRASRAILAAA